MRVEYHLITFCQILTKQQKYAHMQHEEMDGCFDLLNKLAQNVISQLH